MKKLPTDIQILGAIYKKYYQDFIAYDDKTNKTRSSKMYMPIDIEALARKFRIDPDLLFGRLYYHLENKYGYVAPDGGRVSFFSLRIGGNVHCVHFPYLASVYSTMKSENRRFVVVTVISLAAMVISLISVFIS